jgi:hypothetical protein
MARWLQWIVVGVAVALAAFWIGAAAVTAPAMEPPPLIPAHRPAVDAATLAKADPRAYIEPPPRTVLAGAVIASARSPVSRWQSHLRRIAPMAIDTVSSAITIGRACSGSAKPPCRCGCNRFP